jgi:hypothetical protein
MSDQVIRSLADEIRHSHFFALLANETTDVSNRQQLVVCIRCHHGLMMISKHMKILLVYAK